MQRVIQSISLGILYLSIAHTAMGQIDIKKADSLYFAGNFQQAANYYLSLLPKYEDPRRPKPIRDSTLYINSYLMRSLARSGLPDSAYNLSTRIAKDLANNDSEAIKGEYLLVSGELRMSVFSDHAGALKDFRQALSAFERAQLQKRIIETTTYLGLNFSNMGKYDSARYYIKRSLALNIQHNGTMHYTVANAYGTLAHNAILSGHYRQAAKNAMDMLYITSYNVDSTLQDLKGHYETQDHSSFFYHFLTINEQNNLTRKFHPLDIIVLPMAGQAYTQLGNLELSKRLFSAAIQAYDFLENRPLLYETQLLLANLYTLQHQFSTALELYRKLLEHYESPGYQMNQRSLWVYQNMAVAFSRMHMPDSALKYDLKGLEGRKRILSPKHSDLGASYFNLSGTYEQVGDFSSALIHIDSALGTAYTQPELLMAAKARLLAKSGADKEAYKHFKQAIYLSDSGATLNHIETFEHFADWFSHKGQTDSAQYYYNQALRKNYDGQWPDNPKLDSYRFESIIYPTNFLKVQDKKIQLLLKAFAADRNPKHLETITKTLPISLDIIRLIRLSMLDEVDYLTFSDLAKAIIEKGIEAHLLISKFKGSSHVERAFVLADYGKAQATTAHWREQETISFANVTLMQQWASLEKRIRLINKELNQLNLLSVKKDLSAISTVRKRLERLESDKSLLFDVLIRNYPVMEVWLRKNGLNEVQKNIRQFLKAKNILAIQFFSGQDHTYVLTHNGEHADFYRVESTDDSRAELSRLKRFLSSPASLDESSFKAYTRDAHSIFQRYLAKSLAQLKDPKNRIVISPDGKLSGLPMGVLLTEPVSESLLNFGQLPYLLKRHAPMYTASFELLLYTETEPSSKSGGVYTGWAPYSRVNDLQTPEPQNSLLPYTEDEITLAHHYFGGERLINESATEHSFKTYAMVSDILHIATHAEINETNPELSYLSFSKNTSDTLEDGLLHMFEVYAMPLKAEMVVLSACNSGAGQVKGAEGIMSIARVFNTVGAKSVIMSMWLANDESTYKILKGFYAHLASGATKNEALRKSKLSYLQNADNLTNHPYYWAHLLSIGNSNPLDGPSSQPLLKPLLWSLFIVLALMVTFKYKGSKPKKTKFDAR